LTAGEFLDDVTEEARHGDRRRVDRTDQPARLDDRLTGQIVILQQRHSSAISRPRQPLHLPRFILSARRAGRLMPVSPLVAAGAWPAAVRTFGHPRRVYRYIGYTVMVWDANLLTRLR
jgi:hypothetical protein